MQQDTLHGDHYLLNIVSLVLVGYNYFWSTTFQFMLMGLNVVHRISLMWDTYVTIHALILGNLGNFEYRIWNLWETEPVSQVTWINAFFFFFLMYYSGIADRDTVWQCWFSLTRFSDWSCSLICTQVFSSAGFNNCTSNDQAFFPNFQEKHLQNSSSHCSSK